jgi:hypothetical protein
LARENPFSTLSQKRNPRRRRNRGWRTPLIIYLIIMQILSRSVRIPSKPFRNSCKSPLKNLPSRPIKRPMNVTSGAQSEYFRDVYLCQTKPSRETIMHICYSAQLHRHPPPEHFLALSFLFISAGNLN